MREYGRQRKRKARLERDPKFLLAEAQKNSRRRARIRGTECKATTKQIAWLKEMQDHRCAYCGSPDDLELDHKQALARRGRHTLDNLQWLCRPHNYHKRTTHDSIYRQRHGIPVLTPWDWQFRLLLDFA